MTGFQVVALVVTLAALFGYLNFRFFRLPMTIGVMAISLVVSLGLPILSEPRSASCWGAGIPDRSRRSPLGASRCSPGVDCRCEAVTPLLYPGQANVRRERTSRPRGRGLDGDVGDISQRRLRRPGAGVFAT
jgi:hypothetical protein